MDHINDFFDDRNRAWCVHCGRGLAGLKTNRDHGPTKGFLKKSWPPELPVITICVECNTGFSLDEQYAVSFLSSVISGTTEPGKQINASAARAMRKSPALRETIKRSKQEYQTMGGETRLIWNPDMERMSRVIIKNARGHAFFELGEPKMDDPKSVWAHPIALISAEQREEFEGWSDRRAQTLWPEVGATE
ncbi:MAG: hypothetical protein ACI853_001117 [Paracoccaceae bacterium]